MENQVMDSKVEIKPEHWEEARKEFPKDEMLAEIHAICYAMRDAQKGLSPAEVGKLYAGKREPKAA